MSLCRHLVATWRDLRMRVQSLEEEVSSGIELAQTARSPLGFSDFCSQTRCCLPGSLSLG